MKRDSVAARLQYADEVLPQIIDSANDPLKVSSIDALLCWTDFYYNIRIIVII